MHIKAAAIETGTENFNKSRIAYPPKTVIKVAHKLPIIPIRIASIINPVKGFTSPIRRVIIKKLLRFFILFHRPYHSFQGSAASSKALYKHLSF